jgi:hypothetical protein
MVRNLLLYLRQSWMVREMAMTAGIVGLYLGKAYDFMPLPIT